MIETLSTTTARLSSRPSPRWGPRWIGSLVAFALLGCAVPVERGRRMQDVVLEDLDWSEMLPPGSWLRIRNFQGPIEVQGTRGSAVVRVEPLPAGRDDSTFPLRVVRDKSSVTVCAVLPGEDCSVEAPWRYRPAGERPRTRNRLVVRVPEGVHVHARADMGDATVRDIQGDVVVASGFGSVRLTSISGSIHVGAGSGNVHVDRAEGRVVATTGNGNIRVASVSGPIEVNTGNGNIDAELRSIRAPEDMHLSSGNGSIVLWLPGGYQGAIDASTGYGRFSSEFTLAGVARTPGQRHVRGTIGSGGRSIFVSTGRGDIQIRQLD